MTAARASPLNSSGYEWCSKWRVMQRLGLRLGLLLRRFVVVSQGFPVVSLAINDNRSAFQNLSDSNFLFVYHDLPKKKFQQIINGDDDDEGEGSYEKEVVGEPVNANFFSIMVNGVSDHELHLDDVVKQRQQLHHLRVNLKARLIVT
ncbi:hypothetical protein E3N88_43965 [Mikania micrantha]|uniref:Uncharacterized protein n=1 Tax=Mikania micrantha TaxID=192012 RepID=A0A5N6LDE7_9ASTR|nr:hypothetical protein E3N88_43965 [Mikania micrantha]